MTPQTFSRKLRLAEKALAASNSRFKKVIKEVGPCLLSYPTEVDPFAALVRSICHQQLHGKAAETIHRRVVEKFSKDLVLSPNKVRRAKLPTLRSCGLSTSKSLAISDLASKVLDGTVPTGEELLTMPDERIVERLTEVRGIGRWTAEMLLIFSLGRLDVLPVDDFGVRRGYSVLFALEEMIKPKELALRGESLSPYRSVASWYLWRVADNAK